MPATANPDEPQLDPDPEDILLNVDPISEHYPPLASQANCAKNWDISLLQNFTAKRLRSLGRQYQGVTAKMNKPEMFQVIFDAMSEDQDCQTCGGVCNPLTHFFPPIENLPLGWVRGADGLFHKPQQSTETTAPGTSSSVSGTQHDLPFSTADLSSVSSNLRSGIPAGGLLRTSNSPDLRTSTSGAPLIPGVSQQQPTPPNLVSTVVNGGAGLGGGVFVEVDDEFEREIDAQLRREAEQEEGKR